VDVTEDDLAVRLDLPLDEIRQVEVRQFVGGGLLEARRGEERVELVRFSRSLSEQFANTCEQMVTRLVARGAAKLMAADDGPRIAALAFDGWDTHANEGGPVGRLAQLLSGLDGALAEFESGLGGRWRDTVLVVATEFGRTARINGTEGTDHGTGTVALLAGGAVNGGRVISDWPGLKPGNLYEGRDLAPTTDLRAVIKGVLRDHLGLAERVLAETVFPDSAPVKPIKGLVA